MNEDIKPDTSLYEYNSPEFFMALALIAGKNVEVQTRERGCRSSQWSDTFGISHISRYDHRFKPEPRVVWVVFRGDGSFATSSEDKSISDRHAKEWNLSCANIGPYTVARFVESPQ